MLDMTIVDQVLSYLKVLIWPSIVALVILLFREQIGGILTNLEEFEGFGVRAKVHRRITQAAEEADATLARSNIDQQESPSGRFLVVIAISMRRALQFSSNLIYPPLPVLRRHRLRAMQQVVEKLNTAIVAILTATILPDSEEARGPRLQAIDPG